VREQMAAGALQELTTHSTCLTERHGLVGTCITSCSVEIHGLIFTAPLHMEGIDKTYAILLISIGNNNSSSTVGLSKSN
jgi:hypothetical protein